MATSKEWLDDIVNILKSSGYVSRRETAGKSIKQLVSYRAAAEQGIGSVDVRLKAGDLEGASKEMDLLIEALDKIES
jgi:hypothetical protein